MQKPSARAPGQVTTELLPKGKQLGLGSTGSTEALSQPPLPPRT